VNLDYVAQRAWSVLRNRFIPRAPTSPRFSARKISTTTNIVKSASPRSCPLDSGQPALPRRVFHPGYLYQERYMSTSSRPLTPSPSALCQIFRLRQFAHRNEIPANNRLCRFRVLYPLNKPGQLDELGAFIGASYSGSSARISATANPPAASALDSREGDRPEEFPSLPTGGSASRQKDDTQIHLFRHPRQRELRRRL